MTKYVRMKFDFACCAIVIISLTGVVLPNSGKSTPCINTAAFLLDQFITWNLDIWQGTLAVTVNACQLLISVPNYQTILLLVEHKNISCILPGD